jgi:hypothetical protein
VAPLRASVASDAGRPMSRDDDGFVALRLQVTVDRRSTKLGETR